MGHTTQNDYPHYHQSNELAERSIQTVKQIDKKEKLSSEDHFLAVLSLNSLQGQNRTSPADNLFGHKLRTTLPLLIPFTQSAATEKHTVTQKLRPKVPDMAPGTTVRIRTEEQNLWNKKGIVVS